MVDLEAIEARAKRNYLVSTYSGWVKAAVADRVALIAEVNQLRAALEAIAKHSPREVCKDDFAYDRLLEAVHEAAQEALK